VRDLENAKVPGTDDPVLRTYPVDQVPENLRPRDYAINGRRSCSARRRATSTCRTWSSSASPGRPRCATEGLEVTRPTFKWDVLRNIVGDQVVKSRLYVSVLPAGEGLFPDDSPPARASASGSAACSAAPTSPHRIFTKTDLADNALEFQIPRA
jgi:hypothetical protein